MNPDEILAAARRRHARVPPDPRATRAARRSPTTRRRRTRSPTPPTCARRSSGSSRRTATSRRSRASCRSGAHNARARDPQLPPARRGARREGHAARRSSSTPRTRTSRRSPSRRRTCGARSGCCRATLDDARRRRSARSRRSRTSSAPASRRCGRSRAHLGPALRRDAAVPARDHADHPRRDPAVRAHGAQPGARAAPRGRASWHPTTPRLNSVVRGHERPPQHARLQPARATRRATSSGPRGRTTTRAFVFNTQDAHGPIRRGNFLVDCASLVRRLESARPGPARSSRSCSSCSNAPEQRRGLRAAGPTPAGARTPRSRRAKAAKGGFD